MNIISLMYLSMGCLLIDVFRIFHGLFSDILHLDLCFVLVLFSLYFF